MKQILTGSDNQTMAIGRVLGAIVFVLFVIVMPTAAVVTIGMRHISAADWSTIFDQMRVYIPSVILSVGGMIGMTAPSEPKASKDNENG